MNTIEQTRNGWDGVAAGYDEYVTPLVIPLAEKVLGRVGIGPGTQLLDVAAGTGGLSVVAARLGAQVMATDISPGMIERLEARVSAERLTNVRTRVSDARTLEFEEDVFDVSASQLGVTVLPDAGRALAEMVRVTRRGGKVVIAALGPPQKAEFFGFFLAAVKVNVPGFVGPPTDPPPPQFQMSDQGRFRDRLAEAGLADINVETITFGLRFGSAHALWGFLMSSNPMGRLQVAELSEQERAGVQQVLAGMLRERSERNQGAVLSVDVNLGIGTK